MPPVAVTTRLSLAQVVSSDPVTVRPNGSAVEMDVYANFAGTLTVGQQVLTGFDESGRLVVFAQTTNPDYIPNTEGAIQSYNIADAAVTRENILAGAIDRTRIAQGEVTAALIAIDAINETHISPEAITTPAIAANAITGYHVVANSISASHIAAYSITAQEIAAQSIVASRILAGTITADRIATGTITATQIAANTITSTQIQAGTIQASDIATGTLTSASGVFGTISANDITTGTLTADRIGAGTLSVGTIILNGAVLSSNNYNGDFNGATGWSMSGTSAVFNNVTVRGVLSGVTGTFSGNLSGGTIDIGGADASSFHVDSAGNMWLGAATYATAADKFRVSSAGEAECAVLQVGTFGTLEYQSDTVTLYHTGVGASAGDVEIGAYGDIRLNSFTLGGGAIQMYVNGTERVVLGNTGGFQAGVNNPPTAATHAFYVDRDSHPVLVIANRAPVGAGTAHGIDIYLGATGSPLINTDTGDAYMRFRRPDGTVLGQIRGNGGGTDFVTTSDRSLKADISADLAEGAAAFDEIPWRTWRWKSKGTFGAGVVAQQLAKVPRWEHLVHKGGVRHDLDEHGKRRKFYDQWGVDYVPLIGAMGAKIKQLEARIAELESV